MTTPSVHLKKKGRRVSSEKSAYFSTSLRFVGKLPIFGEWSEPLAYLYHQFSGLKGQRCPVLGKTYIGANCNFEIWEFKVFFLWTRKAALRMTCRCSDLNIKIGKITQEIPHTA